MKYLIVGLGNIGAEYELTRHNIGFLVLDQLADKRNAEPFVTSRYADKTEIRIKGKTLHLIKPTTYMNLSGKAVNYWLKELKIDRKNLLVVVDDVALPFGNLRMRGKGSSAGHNGLKHIEETLEGQDYARLRFGIGDNYPKGHQVEYVLSRFTAEEFTVLPEVINHACEMIETFCTAGIERAMNLFNS